MSKELIYYPQSFDVPSRISPLYLLDHDHSGAFKFFGSRKVFYFLAVDDKVYYQ